MTRARRAVVVAVAVVATIALVATSCTGDDGPGLDEASLEVLDGTAVVTLAEGGTDTVTDDTILAFGDTVAVEEGSAVLSLADGSTYELRGRDEVGSTVVVGAPPVLTAGDALVTGGFPAQIRVDTATLTAQGALRVDAEETVAVAYAGRTRVAGVGDIDELLGLRRLVLVPGATPEPVVFDGSDEWDRRYLGEAIAFGEQLEALARGYTSDLPPDGGRTVEFFQAVVPALDDEREFGPDLLDADRAPGETLVGAAIAVQGRIDTFRDRWGAIFAFRDAGAAWGLVALDQGVGSAPVLETIQLAIGGSASSTSTTSSTSTSTSTSSTSSPDPTPTTETTTTTAPPEDDPPDDDPLDPTPDPGGDVLDELLDVLGVGEP